MNRNGDFFHRIGGAILLVAPSSTDLELLTCGLREGGRRVERLASAREADRRIQDAPPSVVLTTLETSDLTGLRLLCAVRQRHPFVPVILLTGANPPSATVLDALRLGATDLMPVDEPDAVLSRVRGLLGIDTVTAGDDGAPIEGLVGNHPSIRSVLQVVRAAARTRATLLIHGESGTGKSMMARVLHGLSERRAAPFVEVACGALPEELIESELFGHVRGAFTGSVGDRAGKVEIAHRGTLFLDEVGVASPALQVKLLRVLQERAFERLGSSETQRVDIRLVLATNMNLEDAVKQGRFREDLYYRINVVTVDLPPLRARQDDIPALAQHFLKRFAAEHGCHVTAFSPDVIPVLCGWPWPGNVRELENVVERAVVLCPGEVITCRDLPPRMMVDSAPTIETDLPLPLKRALEGPERAYLRRVLSWTSGNRQRAADILGINRSTLFNKMRKHALLAEDFGAGRGEET